MMALGRRCLRACRTARTARFDGWPISMNSFTSLLLLLLRPLFLLLLLPPPPPPLLLLQSPLPLLLLLLLTRARRYAFQQAYALARPTVLEPIMKLEVSAPTEFQGSVIGILSKRKGQMQGSETIDASVVIEAAVPLSQMFGFSTELRSATQVCPPALARSPCAVPVP